jgi:endo-1,4-beta-D-glucanase Y
MRVNARSLGILFFFLCLIHFPFGCSSPGPSGASGSGTTGPGSGGTQSASGVGGATASTGGATGVGGGAGGAGGAPLMCAPTQTLCTSTCVETATFPTNNSHCGGCNVVCPAGTSCSASTCQCQTGFMACTDGCKNLLTDGNNCGACGTICPAGEACLNGGCQVGCGTLTQCGNSCVDTTSDVLYCGSCTNACSAGTECVNSACVCPSGQVFCMGGCVDQATAPPECTSTCAPSAGLIDDFEDQDMAIVEQESRVGEWADFNNGGGTQTLAIEASGGTETCDQYALHTTGSGFSEYVGISVNLGGTDESPVVYNAGAQSFTGIRFRAKKGPTHDSQSPVRFNISTPWTEGTDSGGTCVDNGSVVRCYNHLGRFLIQEHELTADWKDFTFCFDRDLYPLFVPIHLSADQRRTVAQNVLKVQFQFNKGKNLSAQPDPSTNQLPEYAPSLPFDFWLDDVSFITESCDGTPSFQSTDGATLPFPQNGAVGGTCQKPADSAKFAGAIADAYIRWKAQFLRNSGGGAACQASDSQCMVYSPEDNRTISEAEGYGMLITAAMGDKPYFDKIWAFTQAQFEGNPGLMRWTPGGSGSATDADEDIAYALLIAGAQWGGNYATAAGTMAGAIRSRDINGSNQVRPGSNWSTDYFNPSYFTPYFYRVFSGDWASVISTGYTNLNACNAGFGSASNGLVPDWCSYTGTALSARNDVGADVISDLCTESNCPPMYSYDAARVPWRIGVDACKGNNATARSYLQQLAGHMAGLHSSGERIDLMKAGFGSNGQSLTGAIDNQMSFLGPMGVGAMGAGNQVMTERLFRAVLDIIDNPEFNRTYYPTTIGLISLLEMSGNIPHR